MWIFPLFYKQEMRRSFLLLRKINSLNKQNHGRLIHTWWDKAFKGTVVNRAQLSLHGICPLKLRLRSLNLKSLVNNWSQLTVNLLNVNILNDSSARYYVPGAALFISITFKKTDSWWCTVLVFIINKYCHLSLI